MIDEIDRYMNVCIYYTWCMYLLFHNIADDVLCTYAFGCVVIKYKFENLLLGNTYTDL